MYNVYEVNCQPELNNREDVVHAGQTQRAAHKSSISDQILEGC